MGVICMTQEQRRIYLIKVLLSEHKEYSGIDIPDDAEGQKHLLRSLMNVRMPDKISEEFLRVQDEYLKEEISHKGITDYTSLTQVKKDLYLWQGDITTLKCDAIVNAANKKMLGCFVPCHKCIDNSIHTYSGVQLRLECAEIMRNQRHDEKTGSAKLTPADNLPCKYIIHTVGPIVRGGVSKHDEELLASCYRSCLELAQKYSLKSIAFCCISTGEFMFPNRRAAEIAIDTVSKYKEQTQSEIKVIFNVFKQVDLEIYRELLG